MFDCLLVEAGGLGDGVGVLGALLVGEPEERPGVAEGLAGRGAVADGLVEHGGGGQGCGRLAGEVGARLAGGDAEARPVHRHVLGAAPEAVVGVAVANLRERESISL